MTREEAISMLKSKLDGHTDTSYEWCECVRMAIKALEQEPFINKPCVSEKVYEHDKNNILDKIESEIEQNAYPIVHGVNNHEKGMTLYGILQIIDKYKIENETDIIKHHCCYWWQDNKCRKGYDKNYCLDDYVCEGFDL